MKKADTPLSASQMPGIATQDLRQRQRDHLAPRKLASRENLLPKATREYGGATPLRLAPVLQTESRTASPERVSAQRQNDSANALYSHPRTQKSFPEIRSTITPDGGSAGREGRQFTVGKVGNNGRIYLR
jgi:hypothetical protein